METIRLSRVVGMDFAIADVVSAQVTHNIVSSNYSAETFPSEWWYSQQSDIFCFAVGWTQSDSRVSSISLGSVVGIGFTVTVISALVVLDVASLKAHIRMCRKKIKKCK